ncbi:hypothetical protein A6E27_23105 [Bacillus cereus]|nr:hypothetical protein A6E27_23105 [Bacillus cereus]
MRQWSKELITSKIVELNDDGIELYSKSMKDVDVGLYLAGRRYFGSWKLAVESAGIDFSIVEERGKVNRKLTMKKEYNKTPNKSHTINGVKHIMCNNTVVLVDEDVVIERKIRVCGTGHVKIIVDNKEIGLHEYIIGKPPKGMEIDHINRIKTDNRRCNLRFSTREQNASNVKRKGCSFVNGKWRSRIVVNNKHIYLGFFDTEEEAHEAYKLATIKYRGEFSPYL